MLLHFASVLHFAAIITLCSVTVINAFATLSDPGADSQGKGKSKRAVGRKESPLLFCFVLFSFVFVFLFFVVFFFAHIDFSLPPLFSPGSPRMCLCCHSEQRVLTQCGDAYFKTKHIQKVYGFCFFNTNTYILTLLISLIELLVFERMTSCKCFF